MLAKPSNLWMSEREPSARRANYATLARPPKRRWRPQVFRTEFRPHLVGEPELGVSAFPEQKIRQSLFTSGADERDRHPASSSYQRPLFVQSAVPNTSTRRMHPLLQSRGCMDNRLARRIVQRHPQMQRRPDMVARSACSIALWRCADNSMAGPMTVRRIPIFAEVFGLGIADRSPNNAHGAPPLPKERSLANCRRKKQIM